MNWKLLSKRNIYNERPTKFNYMDELPLFHKLLELYSIHAFPVDILIESTSISVQYLGPKFTLDALISTQGDAQSGCGRETLKKLTPFIDYAYTDGMNIWRLNVTMKIEPTELTTVHLISTELNRTESLLLERVLNPFILSYAYDIDYTLEVIKPFLNEVLTNIYFHVAPIEQYYYYDETKQLLYIKDGGIYAEIKRI